MSVLVYLVSLCSRKVRMSWETRISVKGSHFFRKKVFILTVFFGDKVDKSFNMIYYCLFSDSKSELGYIINGPGSKLVNFVRSIIWFRERCWFISFHWWIKIVIKNTFEKCISIILYKESNGYSQKKSLFSI